MSNLKMDRIKYFWSKTNRWHRVFTVFFMGELGLVPAGQLGFECNDPTLSHPFTGDTITWKWLIAITVFLPFIVLLLIERAYHNDKPTKARTQAIVWYKEYLFGLLLNLTAIQNLKILVGAPRPHFFDTCRPVEAETCQGSEWVSGYSCTQGHWLARSNQSFPSGHTSLAVHAAFFIAWYIHRRVSRGPGGARALRLAHCALSLSAAACAGSRLFDRRHHWRDVAAGAMLAAPVTYYTVFLLCKDFQPEDTKVTHKPTSIPNHNSNSRKNLEATS